MQKLLTIFGLVVAAIIAIAAYPYVQMTDGKILIVDGKIQFKAGYLPPTNTWLQGPGCPVAIDLGVVGVLSDGVHIIGGPRLGTTSTNHFLYNGTNWTYLKAPPASVNFAGGAVLSNKWYVSYRINGGVATNFISWTGGGSAWTQEPSPGNIYHSAWTTYRGKIWRIGDIGIGDGLGTNVWSFDGTTWTPEAALPIAVYNSSAGVYNDKIYLIGNYNGNAGDTNVFIYGGSSWASGPKIPMNNMWGLTVTNNQNELLLIVAQEEWARTNTYSFNGTNWTEIKGLAVARIALGNQGGNWNGTVYCISGGVTNMEYILPSN